MQVSFGKDPNDRASGDHDRDRIRLVRDRRGGKMAASETESHLYLLAGGIEVTARRQNRAGIVQNECAVQLGDFFDRPAEVGFGDLSRGPRMAREGVKNKGAGVPQDDVRESQGEQGTDTSPFSSFPCNFDREFQEGIQHIS